PQRVAPLESDISASSTGLIALETADFAAVPIVTRKGSMKRNCVPQWGSLNPRVLLGIAICSAGILLTVFSFAATPSVETRSANIGVKRNPANFPSTLSSDANQTLPG